MPYKDPDRQRRFQREYARRRRAEFFAGKACVDCGSSKQLELDHVNRSEKLSHKIWSWSKVRRDAELAKCVVRCRGCHQERHAAERRQDHGMGAYKRGCRCLQCRAANAEKNRRYLAKRRGRESNAPTRICSPLPEPLGHPAEWVQPSLFEEAA